MTHSEVTLLLASVVGPVKWVQRLSVKQHPNERPLMAVKLCYYHLHPPLLLICLDV